MGATDKRFDWKLLVLSGLVIVLPNNFTHQIRFEYRGIFPNFVL
jgi:hypothetical protein